MDDVEGSMDGHRMQAGLVKIGGRIAKGNQLTVMFGPQVFMKARVALDASKFPKQLDYEVVLGTGMGSTQLGVYEWDGKKLRICMAAPGAPRPADFTCAKGAGRTLTVWRPAMA